MHDYDLVVVGSGPAGRSAAHTAADAHKRVAVVAGQGSDGQNAGLHGAAAPSKTLLRAARQLADRGRLSRNAPIPHRRAAMHSLRRKFLQLAEAEIEAIRAELESGGVDVYAGASRFIDPHTIEIAGVAGPTWLDAAGIVIAPGTRAARPDSIPFDGRTVFNEEDILQLDLIPRSMAVVGGSRSGRECAGAFATLGVDVTLIDADDRVRELCREVLPDGDRENRLSLQTGSEAIGVDRFGRAGAAVRLADGTRVAAETVLFAAGRAGNTDSLNLAAAGIEPDERGRLWCNGRGQTWAEHIYGAGDVVGFPILFGDGVEQGRRAVAHAFGLVATDAGDAAAAGVGVPVSAA